MKEYDFIKEYYGDKRTERSHVLLINHIDEGLEILKAINASDDAKKAYCLHPIFQGDEDLSKNSTRAIEFDSKIIMLVMEYRNIANAYLSKRTINTLGDIVLSPLQEVNHMLIADKIQNFKDFMQYHFASHERSNELFEYFKNWFKKLDIPNELFNAIQKDSKVLHLELLKNNKL